MFRNVKVVLDQRPIMNWSINSATRSLLSAGLAAVLILLPAVACSARSGFDARRPADVLEVLSARGADGVVKTDDIGMPIIADKLGFEVDFYDCDAGKTICRTVIYIDGWNTTALSLQQINAWNRMIPSCPATLTPEGHPHLTFYVVASGHDTKTDVAAQAEVWGSCLGGFESLIKDPAGFFKQHDAGG